MRILIIANSHKEWPFRIPDVDVVDARAYLTQPEFSEGRGVKVFNLCRSYRYQTVGYYVSLLAEARGHKPLPSITTLQDLRSQAMMRIVSEELEDLIQHSLGPIQSERFTLSIYFGRNLAKRYERLSLHLFNLFQSPLLRVQFKRYKKWVIRNVATIAASDVPEGHWPFVLEVARQYFEGRRGAQRKRARMRYDLAILHNPDEAEPPSEPDALKKFIRAAESLGVRAELITRDDYARIAEFDALFIRETTAVNHHTYRFSSRASSEGLVVIDDPVSIVRCTNKVYLAELLSRHDIPTPKTIVIHRDNAAHCARELGFPLVLKRPDSSFSRGVVKVASQSELNAQLTQLFEDSDLLVAQEFLPTTFDWRIGILNRKPMYACKYFMAADHWQIVRTDANGDSRYGKSETIPVELAPRRAVGAALKAANLIGDGLYGVDVKESNKKFYVIEVNDNPNVDVGVEDAVLRDELYNRVMEVFLDRIERSKAGIAAT
ncbi:MAG TPA: RimK family protein [Planctomycetaceae bacterium]|nr:RimK family protein [Planctomycetaceae bacterium]